MGFNCGIVGLPNVGKSALFNAPTATQAAEATKYPFSTKEANIGRVAVPDERLDVCARSPNRRRSADATRIRRHRRTRARRLERAGAGQPVSRPPARSRRDRPHPALLRGRQYRACRGLGRSGARRRDRRDRTDAGRSRQPGAPHVAAQKRARGGDKEAKALLADEPVLARCGTAGRRAASLRRRSSAAILKCSNC